MPRRVVRPWSRAEDEELRQLAVRFTGKDGTEWGPVAVSLGRTPASCRARWARQGTVEQRHDPESVPNGIAQFRDWVLDDIAKQAKHPAKRPPRVRSTDTHMLEVCGFDLHVGKYAWGAETGSDDWDSEIAKSVFGNALEDLLAKASGFPTERIVIPIGNDLLQTDSEAGTTTAGTYVDTDTRYVRSFRVARALMSWAIRRAAEIAPVLGVIVRGNHDSLTAFHLGEVLAAEFDSHPSVSIDNGPTSRKYVRYGTVLLGYAHGHAEKLRDLPQIMAHEAAKDWAECSHREIHVGHTHRVQTLKMEAQEVPGVRIRTIPALCPPDAWHSRAGFVGSIRAAEAYLWSRESGYVGHVSSSVMQSGRHPVALAG